MGHNITRGVFHSGNYRIVVSEILCSSACPFAKIVLGFSNSLLVIICVCVCVFSFSLVCWQFT
jgi:hypothetical protein